MSDSVIIPDGLVPPSRVNPQALILYGPPKVGKTTAVAALPDSLILELEPAGADFVSARKIDVPDMKTFLATINKLIALREAKTPACKRLVIDTMDQLEVLAKASAFAKYKASVLGKTSNATDLFELDMGQGYGRLRDEVGELLWLCVKAAEELILLAHVRDKFIERKGMQEVSAQDIDLTGKVRSLVCSRVSSIGFVRRDFTGTLYVNFGKKADDIVICESRCAHLSGKEIELGKNVGGKLVFEWSKIYLPDAPAPVQQQTTTAPSGA